MVTFAKLPGFLCATSFKFTSWSSIWMSCMHPWNDGWRTEWLALFMWFKNPVKQKEQEDYNEYPASFIKGLPSIWVDTATWLMLAFLWFLLTRIRCATSWEYEIYFRQESGSGVVWMRIAPIGSHIWMLISTDGGTTWEGLGEYPDWSRYGSGCSLIRIYLLCQFKLDSLILNYLLIHSFQYCMVDNRLPMHKKVWESTYATKYK